MDDPVGEVILSRGPAATIATVIGDIDPVNAEHVRAVLTDATDTATARVVVVELSGVTFLGSTGLTLLVEAWSRATEAGLALCLVTGDNRAASRPLQITQVDQAIPTFATLSEAHAALALDADPAQAHSGDAGVEKGSPAD